MIGRTDERRRRDDSGMSLAELVVTMGLMALVGTLVVTVAMVVTRTYAGVNARLDATTQGSLGMAGTSKVLRTAILPEQLEDVVCVGCTSTAIVTASPTAVMFYANIGNTSIGPSKVTLRVVANQGQGTSYLLQETEAPIKQGTGSYTFCNRSNLASCTIRPHVLARGLLGTSPAVFTYYDYEGIAIPASSISSNIARISSIDVVLKVGEPGSGYRPRTTVARVRLPNVEINVLTETT